MKLKIISDGNTMLTKVVNVDTGEALPGVIHIKWECGIDMPDPYRTRAVITFEGVEIEATGESPEVQL